MGVREAGGAGGGGVWEGEGGGVGDEWSTRGRCKGGGSVERRGRWCRG